MLWDAHTHTNFSHDSKATATEMIAAAKKIGLAGMCITDHMELDNGEVYQYTMDVESYAEQYLKLREAQSDDTFSVRLGLELGLCQKNVVPFEKITAAHDYDFIIASQHRFSPMKSACLWDSEIKAEANMYMEYFEEILRNIGRYNDFDVMGHIDYVVRYGPNQNKYYSYEKFSTIIDEILKALITKGKGIEINTSGFKYGLGHPHPTEEIISRYRELGGEIITMGSDAHAPENLAFDYDKAIEILKWSGFKYFAVFKNRKPEFYPLP